jgi:hypothetical protein
VFPLECPTPPTLSLAPPARPLKTSHSEHHQIIAPQRGQLCAVADTAVVTRSRISSCAARRRSSMLGDVSSASLNARNNSASPGSISGFAFWPERCCYAKLIGAPKRRSPRRPRWVNRVKSAACWSLPVCSQLRTWRRAAITDAMCQQRKWTAGIEAATPLTRNPCETHQPSTMMVEVPCASTLPSGPRTRASLEMILRPWATTFASALTRPVSLVIGLAKLALVSTVA